MRNKYISRFLRTIGLAWVGDYTRFQLLRLKNKEHNHLFKQEHPDIILPPDYTLYESFQMDYAKYFLGGKEDAQELIGRVAPYCNLKSGRILDWGCGPARLIRHFPSLLGHQNEYYGTDYNPTTVSWCKANIPEIQFSMNDILPPLTYPIDYFDLIYGISIFTHLSPENHFRWSDELFKHLKAEGVLYVTSHGNAFLERLTADEQVLFQQGKIVSRTKVKEGHRMYAAFQPPSFMKSVFEKSGFQIVKHIPGIKVNEDYIQQDVWMLRRQT